MSFLNYNGHWSEDGKPVNTFPIQDNRADREVPIPVAEEAYKEYAAQYGTQQSLKCLADRGGFGSSEIAILLYERCKRLESQITPTERKNQ